MAGEGDVELGPVNIGHTVQLLLNYDEEVQNRSKQYERSIYMVPSVFRDLSPSSFTPRVVPIGPLHHKDEHLKGFEVHKATYMHNLLHNVLVPLDSTPEQILEECVTKVSDSLDKIKACYVAMPTTYSDSELVKMMVTDACFILAFIHNFEMLDSSLGQNSLLYPHIFTDMVLIENQIPFFVLQDIFNSTFLNHYPVTPPPLSKTIFQVARVCRIFEPVLDMDSSSILTPVPHHILGFIHKFYQHPHRTSSTLNEMVQGPSVIELERSGVRFSKILDDAASPMEMKLEFSRPLFFPKSWSKPTLKMPVLRLVDDTESFIRNLIIYEHSSQVQMCVTSYMHALDTLIDTPEDVAKLVKSKVIVNYLGSDENASELINSMLKEVSIDEFFYKDEWKLLDEHYNAKWPKFIAELRRTYFNNPWSIIAIIAGIMLFILTVVQTVYSVKAGVKDSKAA